MKLFITGASGYIGGAVARHMRDAGHAVTALARTDASAAALRAEGFAVHRGHLADPGSLVDAVHAAEGVIHTAVGGPRGVTEGDAAALEAMVDALSGSGAPLVLTSGLGVYAGVRAPVVDEDTPLGDAVPQQQPRIRLERQAAAAAERGVRTIVLRPANVYGRGRAGLFTRMQMEYAASAGAGAYTGSGASPYPAIHVDDVVTAYAAALDRAAAGTVYNLVGHAPTLREVAGAMSIAAGGGGRTVALSVEEAREAWGPVGAMLSAIPAVSALRAAADLGWTPRAPTLAWELTHGSLRTGAARHA